MSARGYAPNSVCRQLPFIAWPLRWSALGSHFLELWILLFIYDLSGNRPVYRIILFFGCGLCFLYIWHSVVDQDTRTIFIPNGHIMISQVICNIDVFLWTQTRPWSPMLERETLWYRKKTSNGYVILTGACAWSYKASVLYRELISLYSEPRIFRIAQSQKILPISELSDDIPINFDHPDPKLSDKKSDTCMSVIFQYVLNIAS